jgi:hypothetical protein
MKYEKVSNPNEKILENLMAVAEYRDEENKVAETTLNFEEKKTIRGISILNAITRPKQTKVNNIKKIFLEQSPKLFLISSSSLQEKC